MMKEEEREDRRVELLCWRERMLCDIFSCVITVTFLLLFLGHDSTAVY